MSLWPVCSFRLLHVLNVFLLFACSIAMAQTAAVNDERTKAFAIYGPGFVPANNDGASAEVSEPSHGGLGHSLWWKWQAGEGEHVITLRPYAPGLSFVLVIYAEGAAGQLTEVARVTASDMEPHSALFSAEAGVDYLLVVDSTTPATGWFYFSINQAPEIHAPLSVYFTKNGQISIPVHISGFPTEVEVTSHEAFSYDSNAKQIIGSLPSDREEARIDFYAINDYGIREVAIELVRQEEDFAITSPASALGFVGVPFEYVVEFAGAPGFLPRPLEFRGLPEGIYLTLEDNQWILKGIPRSVGAHRIEIQSRDAYGLFSNHYIEAKIELEFIEYADAHLQPSLTSPMMARITPGVPFTYQLESSLPVTEFYANNLPQWLSLNVLTGVLSGTPTEERSERFYVGANYPYGYIEGELSLIYSEYQTLEIIAPPIIYAYAGIPFDFVLEASLPVEEYNLSGGLPPGLTSEHGSDVISGTPTVPGTYDFWIRARNPTYGDDAEMELTIKVLDGNCILHLTSPAQASGTRGSYFEYQLETQAASLEGFNFSVNSMPAGLRFDETTQKIVGVPQNDGLQFGSIELGDNIFEIQFAIADNKTPPEFLNSASTTYVWDEFFYYPLNANGASYYQIIQGALPEGLELSNSSGVISGLPVSDGHHTVVIRAFGNGTYADSSLTFRLETATNAPERKLILSPGRFSGQTGEALVYQINSNAPPFASYYVQGLPSGFYYDSYSGLIYGSSEFPVYRTILVAHGEASAEVILEVRPSDLNDTPFLVTSPPGVLVEVGQPLEFQIETNAMELEAHALDFSPSGSWPDSLALNRNSGRITGLLNKADLPATIGFSAHSSEGVTESFLTLVDAAKGRPPLVESNAHILVEEYQTVEYCFDIPDPNVELELQNLPPGFSFDPIGRKLVAQLGNSLEEIDFEVINADDRSLYANGTLTFQALREGLQLIPIITSAIAPVAEAGSFFSYQFEFDPANTVITDLFSDEDWLRQTGPSEISGVAPQRGGPDDFQVYVQYSYFDSGNAQMRMRIADPDRPPVVTSPSSATAYLGSPFSYELILSEERAGDQITVSNLPGWASYDPTTKMVSGIPDDIGFDELELEIATSAGTFYSTITLLAIEDDRRPLIAGYSAPPAFHNVPFVLPILIEGPFEQLEFNASGQEEFWINSTNTAVEGLPLSFDSDSYWIGLNVNGLYHSTYVDIPIRGERESAPVFITHPRSMVTFEGGKAYFNSTHGEPDDVSGDWHKEGDASNLGGPDGLEIHEVTLADQGDYYLRLESQVGEAISRSARLTLGTPHTLRDWTIAQVGELIDLQPGGEPNESWINDGTSNLMKWALGLPLLEETREEITIGGYTDGILQLQFLRNVNAEDVTLLVERSQTLAIGSWEPIARRLAGGSWQSFFPEVSVSENGLGETRQVTVQDTTARDFSFIRVSVQLEE